MWNDDYYYVLEDEFGPARAKLVADSHRDSITEVEKVRPRHSCSFPWHSLCHCASLCTLYSSVCIVLLCVHCIAVCALYSYVRIVLLCVHCAALCALCCDLCIVLPCVHCTTLCIVQFCVHCTALGYSADLCGWTVLRHTWLWLCVVWHKTVYFRNDLDLHSGTVELHS